MTTVAHVGAFKPMSMDDRYRWVESVHWLVKHDVDVGKPVEDIVNLINGRDFLKEDRKYDVVVLHSIFDPKRPGHDVMFLDCWACGISDVHSTENWTERLVQTKAKFIFIYETYPMSLSGWSFGYLPGYTHEINARQTIYYRKERKDGNHKGRSGNSRRVPR